MAIKLQSRDGLILLQVKVVPNSSRDQIVGPYGEAIKIKVAQPPEGGKANAAVQAVLADALGIAPSQVTITAGHTRPQKTVAISGITLQALQEKLDSA